MRRTFSVLLALACVAVVHAQLPLARLHSLFPAGGQRGATLEVTTEGADLDGATALHFSAPGLSARRSGTNMPPVFEVTISNSVPAGLYEARAICRFGISNPRFFFVNDRTNLVARTNQSISSAALLPVESTTHAVLSAATADYYRFSIPAGQSFMVACLGEPFDSRVQPSLLLFDSKGREIAHERRSGVLSFTGRASDYLLKVHDRQFRGGKQFAYQLTLTTNSHLELPRLQRLPAPKVAACAPNEPKELAVPGEVHGRFYPEGDVDEYEFSARKGEVLWIETVCERLGLPTSPFVLVQRADGGDVQEIYGPDANVGGPYFNTSSRDPVGRFEAKEDGAYSLKIRDLFNGHADSRREYHLFLRRETPGFDLVALVTPPPAFERDKREAQVWSSFLRQDDTILIKVLALRRDNFNGEIALATEGLPTGVQASESVLREGQNVAWVSLSGIGKLTNWTGPFQIVGRSAVATNTAVAATIVWDVPDYNNETVRSRLTDELVLATSTDAAPFSIVPKGLNVEAAPNATVQLRVNRSAEFKQAAKFRAYLDAQTDAVKEWQVEPSASETTFELNTKEAKLGPGAHTLFFLAQTAGKAAGRDVNAIFASAVLKIVVK